MGKLIIGENGEPSTPSSGNANIYIDTTTKKLASKDDAGLVTDYGVAQSISDGPSQIVYVGKNGNDTTGDGTWTTPYLTIVKAISTITDATSVKQYLVSVGPGLYVEAAITMKEYVSVNSMSRAITTAIVASDINNPIFTTTGNNSVTGFILTGATNSDGIFHNDAGGNLFVARELIIYNCSKGLHCTAGIMAVESIATVASGSMVDFFYLDGAGSIEGGEVLLVNNPTITNVMHCNHADGRISLANMEIISSNVTNIVKCTLGEMNILTGMFRNATNGIHCVGGDTHILNCILDGNTTGVRLNGGDAHVSSCDFEGNTTDLNIEGSTDIFEGSANKMDSDKITVTPGYNAGSYYFLDNKAGDLGLRVHGELAVGRPDKGHESVFGEGDSFNYSMYAYTFDGSSTYTDRTSTILTAGDASTMGFDGVGASNSILITTKVESAAGVKMTFPGVKVNVSTAITIGSGELITEYYNGSWVKMDAMVVTADGNYLTAGEDWFNATGDFQVRFSDRIPSDWVKNDPMSLGTTYYWMRIRINSAITTSPQIDQIKIHTNRAELNEDGFLEYFGKARPIAAFPSAFGNIAAGPDSPSNQDLYLGDSLVCGRNENSFVSTGFDTSGVTIQVPLDLDTSCPLRFRITYIGTSSSSGAVQHHVHWAYSKAGDSVFTSTASPTEFATEQKIIDSLSFGTNENLEQKTVDFDLDVSGIIPERSSGTAGDLFWINVERDGAYFLDTYPGSWVLIDWILYYTKWREGGHINNWT